MSKAANALHISQPSVSKQIKQLEEALGVNLIARIGRAIHLTEEGNLLVTYARNITNLVGNLQADLGSLKDLTLGSLSVGGSNVPSASILPLAVATFKAQYPSIEISMKVASSNHIEQMIMTNEVDLAIVVGKPVSPQIIADFYYEEELVLVLPPTHALAKAKRVLASSVSAEQLLFVNLGKLSNYVKNAFTSRGLSIQKQVNLGSRDAVKTAVSVGLGVSIMARSTVEKDAEAGFVSVRKISDLNLRYPVNIIYHKDKRFSVLGNKFLDFLRQRPTVRTVAMDGAASCEGVSMKKPGVARTPRLHDERR